MELSAANATKEAEVQNLRTALASREKEMTNRAELRSRAEKFATGLGLIKDLRDEIGNAVSQSKGQAVSRNSGYSPPEAETKWLQRHEQYRPRVLELCATSDPSLKEASRMVTEIMRKMPDTFRKAIYSEYPEMFKEGYRTLDQLDEAIAKAREQVELATDAGK